MRRTRRFLVGGAVVTLVAAASLVRVAAAWLPLQPIDGADATESSAAPGPHQVGVTRMELGGLDALVWYPADPAHTGHRQWYPATLRMDPSLPQVSLSSARGTARPDAPWLPGLADAPLVIFSPGFALAPEQYAWFGEAMAGRGSVVVAPDHGEFLDPSRLWESTVDRPRALSAVLDDVEALASAGGAWEGRVALDDVTAAGHSYGGYAVQALAGARIDTASFMERCAEGRAVGHPGVFMCDALAPRLGDMAARAGLDVVPEGLWPSMRDERVTSVISLAGDAYLFGGRGMESLTLPVLAVGGDADADTPLDWGGELTVAGAGGDARLVVLEGVAHMDFLNAPDAARRLATWLPGDMVGDPESRHEVHREVLAEVAEG